MFVGVSTCSRARLVEETHEPDPGPDDLRIELASGHLYNFQALEH